MSVHTAADRPRRVLIRADRLFDGVSDAASAGAECSVLVDAGRIVAVGSGLQVADAEVVDLAGATLLPGLVDPHVHLAFDASADPVRALAGRDDASARTAMTTAARAAAHGGVTTVRDLGDRGYLALELRGREGLPTVLAAGPPITTPGGHCHFLGGEAGQGADGMRAAVREHADRGVDVIKIMASGGNLTPGSRQECAQFSADELRAATDEAHRLGLPVTAHAHAPSGIAIAVAAGVDGLEHVSFWTAEGVDAPAELIELIVARKIVVGATLGLVPVAGVTPPPAVLARLPHIIANHRRMHAAGATIVAGTDAGISPQKPPDVVRHALGQLGVLGMRPSEALRTVTSVAARVCGLGECKGRLAAGYDADILAVDGDPLTEPDAIHRIRAVYVRGLRVR